MTVETTQMKLCVSVKQMSSNVQQEVVSLLINNVMDSTIVGTTVMNVIADVL
jgi:hypothetical protein